MQARVDNCYYVNVREGPGNNYSKFTELANGDIVVVLDYENGWRLVDTSDGEGWVYEKFLTLFDISAENNENPMTVEQVSVIPNNIIVDDNNTDLRFTASVVVLTLIIIITAIILYIKKRNVIRFGRNHTICIDPGSNHTIYIDPDSNTICIDPDSNHAIFIDPNINYDIENKGTLNVIYGSGCKLPTPLKDLDFF